MAMSLRKQYERATKRVSKAMDAIYAAAHPRQDIVFSECRKLASPEANAKFEAEQSARWAIEHEAIMTGRAYRTSGNSVVWR